jgi:hypothetical protein
MQLHCKSTDSIRGTIAWLFTFLLLMLGIVIFSQEAYSTQVGLTWTRFSDPVTGYKIYYGTASGSYTQNIDVSKVTTYTIDNLTSGSTYYIAATDHDAAGNESGFSNELIATIPPAVQKTYSITATSDSNGAIIPSGNPPVSQASNGSSTIKIVTASQGTNQLFTISPNAGYYLADLKASGTSLGVVSNYTFSNEAADHTLNATFAINNYSITVTVGTGGSISPSEASAVTSGGSLAYEHRR